MIIRKFFFFCLFKAKKRMITVLIIKKKVAKYRIFYFNFNYLSNQVNRNQCTNTTVEK